MSDLAQSAAAVQLESVTTTGPVSESMLQSIGGLANFLRANATAVADVIFSALDEPTFQSQRGTNWVLCDGRSVVGSQYQALTGQANIPDARGRVLRMKDNGAGVDPAGDLAIGTLQSDTLGTHFHDLSNHAHGVTITGGTTAIPAVFADAGGGVGGILVGNRTQIGASTVVTLGPNVNQTGNAGSAETRVKSAIVNAFIRIN